MIELTCNHCGVVFHAKNRVKKYCTLACYRSSPLALERLRAQSRDVAARARAKYALPPDVRLTVSCAHCKADIVVQPKEFTKRRNFCNSSCYRRYMSERFDRWIAEPQTIALPQCYDAFLTQDELPCLVDGCDWVGTHLAKHMNFSHGVPREQFKELAGFNRKTGVIPAIVAEQLSETRKGLIAAGVIVLDYQRGQAAIDRTRKNAAIRLEGREHLSKAQAIALVESRIVERKCPQCNIAFDARAKTHKTYCSIRCRTLFRDRRRFDLICGHCGLHFWGTPTQQRQSTRSKPIYCSKACAGSVNGAMPNKRKAPANVLAAAHGVISDDIASFMAVLSGGAAILEQSAKVR